MLLWDAGLRRHRIAASLLLGHVVLIRDGLLLLDRLRHVAWVHLGVALGHASAGLLWWEMLWGRLFGGFDGVGIIDAILAVAGRFGGVQARLAEYQQMLYGRVGFRVRHT